MTDNAKSPILSKNVSSSIGLEPPLRFPGFEDAWERKKLEKICSINPSSGKLPAEFYYIDLECVVNGEIVSQLNVISRANAPSRAQRVLSPDDVLYQTVRPYQKNNFFFKQMLDLPAVASTGYAQIRGLDCSIKFIYHLLHTDKFVLEAMKRSTGTSYPAISSNDLAEIDVCYPTRTEQQKIADFLSLVDERIEKQRQLVEVLKRYKRGALLKIFDGCETWTKYLAKDVGKISTGSSNTQDSVPNGMYPFFIRSASVSKSNKFVYDGEAVLTIGDGQIGKVFHYINGKFDCHQRVYMITKFTNISGRYFYHFFSTFFYNRAMKMSARNTVDSVRMEMIADMPIYVPGKQEELRIVCFLDGIDSQIQKQEQVLESMILYKNGLLQKMFI